MIDCLDDCGYFKLSLKDFSQWFGIDISTVKYCLDILSSLEPLGIFSKDLPHCLLRQLEARQETDTGNSIKSSVIIWMTLLLEKLILSHKNFLCLHRMSENVLQKSEN